MDFEKTLFDELIQDTSNKESMSLAAMLDMEEETRTDRNQAVLTNAAENGEMDAVWIVGMGYLYGKDGFEEDAAEGLYWLSKSDNVKAPLHIAEFYRKEGKRNQALHWIKKAEKEYIEGFAAMMAAEIKEYSLGENVDMQKAEESLNAYIELKEFLNDMKSAYNIALLTAMGYSNNRNVKKALKWLNFLKGRTSDSKMELELLQLNYTRVLSDIEAYKEYVNQALKFMVKRAEAGDEKAIRAMGQYYRYYGTNVKERLYWMNKSAEETGSIVASYWMAEAYFGRYGWKMPVDFGMCKHYLNLAEKSPDENDSVRKKISMLRDEVERKEAERYEKHMTRKEAFDVFLESLVGHVLTVPYGYTHIGEDYYFSSFGKEVREVTEIVLPDTLQYIGDDTFSGFTSLNKVFLPRRLKYLGKFSFQSVFVGALMRSRGKNVIDSLTIPANTKTVKSSLGDIPVIRSLKFEDGRTELDWEIFCSEYVHMQIDEMHIPDSVTAILNPDAGTKGLTIGTMYAPKHLEPQINSIKRGKLYTEIKNIIYR